MSKYGTKIVWSDEDSCWVGFCPEFPFLSSFGDTKEEALAELELAIELAVETFAEEGMELPLVESLPAASGQIRLRLPRYLHEKIGDRAKAEGTSVNTLLVSAIAEYVGKKEIVRIAQDIADQAVAYMSSVSRKIDQSNDRILKIALYDKSQAPGRESRGNAGVPLVSSSHAGAGWTGGRFNG